MSRADWLTALLCIDAAGLLFMASAARGRATDAGAAGDYQRREKRRKCEGYQTLKNDVRLACLGLADSGRNSFWYSACTRYLTDVLNDFFVRTCAVHVFEAAFNLHVLLMKLSTACGVMVYVLLPLAQT